VFDYAAAASDPPGVLHPKVIPQMSRIAELMRSFHDLYGGRARIYRAPGRVNLIGEHTDYNQGFVMPAAIDLYTQVAIAPRNDRKLSVHSVNFAETKEFDLDETGPRRLGHWSDYVRGVAAVLEQAGLRLSGANLVIRSDVPIGSGLSSSAALEVATGYALLATSGLRVERAELAQLCQRAENEFVGMRCGIMDQFAACFGRKGQALMLDCRSLDYELLPLAESVKLVICNSMVKHELASSSYNARRAECEAGARQLSKLLPDVRALRDVTPDVLESYGRNLPELIYKRCRHVVSENARVLKAAAALRAGDLATFGKLMSESHRSLRDDYEVSCKELDILVDLASKAKGVIGARMTGGGFGGCTINLVEEASIGEFKQFVTRQYEKATGRLPEIYICAATDGVGQINF
jgi:galactokinase